MINNMFQTEIEVDSIYCQLPDLYALFNSSKYEFNAIFQRKAGSCYLQMLPASDSN